jgi:hypothetical protein
MPKGRLAKTPIRTLEIMEMIEVDMIIFNLTS